MGVLISPLLWQSCPFKAPLPDVTGGIGSVPFGILDEADADHTAFFQFLGEHQQWHRELAKVTNTEFLLFDDLKNNLANHARVHRDLATALGITAVSDLESFDLRDETSWVSFMFLNGQDHQRFQLVTGL